MSSNRGSGGHHQPGHAALRGIDSRGDVARGADMDGERPRAKQVIGGRRTRGEDRHGVVAIGDAAPAVPYLLPNTGVLVSRRAGCHRFNRPLFDLATVCLTR